MERYAFLFPGQGAQYIGMGKDFYESYEAARLVFEEACDLLSCDFVKLVFEGSAEELTLTKNSQIAIYVTGMAILSVVKKEFPSLQPAMTAGLSLGEYTALTAAEKISFKDCLPLVQSRGAFMHEASCKYPGTMAVILGLALSEVEPVIGECEGVWVANLNCPGQIVISGKKEGMEKAAQLLKEKGARRVLPLEVSGAFHSGLMEEARQKLEPLLLGAKLAGSKIDLVMNVPGDLTSDIGDIRKFLIEQVVRPVRWEKGILAMESKGATCFLEMGCGKTLQGINKKIGVAVPTLSIDKISDLEMLAQSLENKSYAAAR